MLLKKSDVAKETKNGKTIATRMSQHFFLSTLYKTLS